MSLSSRETIQVFPNPSALTRAAALDFITLAKAAITDHGAFNVALAGGSTPKRLYTLLADEAGGDLAAPWDKIQLFFGDERHVGPDDNDSNYRMANETLISRLHHKLPAENVHRIHAEDLDAGKAAADYEAELRSYFTAHQCLLDDFPRFDLILLGMGPDGHTASLFPGTTALFENKRWVVSNWVEKFKTHRITFTYPVLNAAAKVILFVAGRDKAEMVHEVLVTHKDSPLYPVQFVKPVDGEKVWMLDSDASGNLNASA